MEEYILHELQGDGFQETEPEEATPNPITPEMTHETEGPSPNWEMELAQAYVRAQILDGVFPPEEGLRMGTVFPSLSRPYDGREQD